MSYQTAWALVVLGTVVVLCVVARTERNTRASFREYYNFHLNDSRWVDYRIQRHAQLVELGVRPKGSHHSEFMDSYDEFVVAMKHHMKGGK
jgi:hypothetical protein